MQDKQKEFKDRYYAAQTYTPEGIILGENTWDLIANEKVIESIPYPWDGMNTMTYGMRLGELCTYTAGSGIGKSSVMRELAYHIIKNSNHSVGCLFLEESIERTTKGIMSVHANKPLHLPFCESTMEEKRQAWEATLGTNKIRMWDHFGSTDIDNIISKVQYLASGLDCKFIILDHLTMIVSAMTTENERRAIDSIMTRLRTLVQEQNIHLMLVSHLSRRASSDSGHEEGAIVSLSQLRGSHGIAQLSDFCFSLERNGQAEEESKRNRTTVRVLKNRFSGETGPCCWLQWHKDSGRLAEVPNPKQKDNDDFQEVNNGFQV
jgi:twinkle protein